MDIFSYNIELASYFQFDPTVQHFRIIQLLTGCPVGRRNRNRRDQIFTVLPVIIQFSGQFTSPERIIDSDIYTPDFFPAKFGISKTRNTTGNLMFINILNRTDTHQRFKRGRSVYISIVPIGQTQTQPIDKQIIAHKTFLSQIPHSSHRPKRSITIFRIVRNKIRRICPDTPTDRVFIIESISGIAI